MWGATVSDDIVKRLMAFAEAGGVLWDAVYEIERLREELAQMEKQRDYWEKAARYE